MNRDKKEFEWESRNELVDRPELVDCMNGRMPCVFYYFILILLFNSIFEFSILASERAPDFGTI